MNNLFVIFALSFCLLSSSIFAQNFQSTIKSAVESKNYQTAIGELQNLEKTDYKVFTANNYDYLLARLAEKQNDFALAMTNYQKVAERDSVLSEYALWHLSQIARSSGNLILERIYLRKLSIISSQSLLNDAVAKRLARSYFETQNYQETIDLLNKQISSDNGQFVNSSNKSQKADYQNKVRENKVLLGESYLLLKQDLAARKTFEDLINNLPNPAQPDDFALAGAKNLDLIDVGAENFGKITPDLTDSEHYRRALIYQFNRNFPLARLHFQAIAKGFPKSSFLANSLYQIGRGYAQERNFSQAAEWFERVQTEFPDDDIARDALSQSASAKARINKPSEAIASYQRFIEKYPNADNLERAYLNIVDVLRDQGNNVEALKWTAKTQADFKGKLPEAIALFVQARVHLVQNDWTNALSDLSILQTFPDLGGTKVPGGTNKEEIAFLKGLTLEKLSRIPEAIDVYLSIPDGRNEYYGWRATERLKSLPLSAKLSKFTQLTQINETAAPDEKRKISQAIIRFNNDPSLNEKMLKFVKTSYDNLPNYKIPSFKLLEFGRKEALKQKRADLTENKHKIFADELLFLGLYDEGTPELDFYFRQSQTKLTDDAAFTLATFYKRGDMADKAISFIEPLWRKIPADYQIELIPREHIELLYPAPYDDSLLKFGTAKNVDPRFMLSIMRQESRFRPDVKSYAAARGLMQFISTTADELARELNRENFKQDELYNPPTAILFGSQYLSNLFKLFPDQQQAVAASYNGGEDNMARWLARSKSNDPDFYVAEIAFSQSKDYVYKVLAADRVYRMIYDENLKSK